MSILERQHSLSWIIVGPESSGSKFAAKVIASRYDISDWSGSYAVESEDILIYHRSCPFERPKRWSPAIINEIEAITKNSLQINVIFTTRDVNISTSRKSIRFGECSISEANYDLSEAQKLYFYLKERVDRIFIWSYETMTLLGKEYINSCFEFFAIKKVNDLPEIHDRNKDFIFNSSFFEDHFSAASLTYNVNFYRSGDEPELDHVQATTLRSIIKAINASPNRQIKIVVSTSSRDHEYIRNLCSENKRLCVRLLGQDSRERSKPYLRDILAHDIYYPSKPDPAKSHNSFCLYANADICIPPYFFELIFQQISISSYSNESYGGFDSVAPDCYVINRRDIFEDGIEWHPGSDLFIFPAQWLDTMRFGNTCIGLPPIAPVIWLNCLYHSRRTVQISDLHITSHYGNDQTWRQEKFSAEAQKNYDEAGKAFRELIKYNIENIAKIDFINHSILPKKRLQSLINEWTECMRLP